MSGLIALTALGCSSDAGRFEVWDPLTIPEVEQSLVPSADLGEDVAPEVLELLAERILTVVEYGEFEAQLLDRFEELDTSEADAETAAEELPEQETPPETTDEVAYGASFYLALACPGVDADLPSDFSEGRVLLRSPLFTRHNLRALRESGDFQISFEACRIGDFLLDRKMPGRYLTKNEVIDWGQSTRLSLALQLSDDEDSEVSTRLGVVGFSCPLASCTESLDFAVQIVLPSGTLVARFALGWTGYWGTRSFSVALQDRVRTLQCTFSYQAVGSFRGSAPKLVCDG